jgi:hypothetical protein
VPHRPLTREQALDYKMQLSFHTGPETLRSYLERLEYRVRYYRFFFLATIREFRFVWVALTLLLFSLGANFFPAFQLHYIAAVTCLFVLMSVTGLERLSRLGAGRAAARLIVLFSVAHFLFWYGVHVFDDADVSMAMRPYETWDAINHGNPERRIYVIRQLAAIPGKLLVFVRYYPQHIFQDEWVYNAANIDAARVVWARDLGEAEDEKLRGYYPDRAVWLLEPDFRPPKLTALPPTL